MHQTVLMHADIDEGAEVGDVGHHAFEHHARLEVLEAFHAFLELGGLELRTRVAAWFVEFLEDVGDGRQAEGFVGELLGVEALEEARIADQRADVAARGLGDALHQRIGFRVHGGGVQRVVAVHHAQEAGGLLEGLVAQTRHLEQLGAALEGAVGIAERHDVLRQGRIEAGNARQQGGRGGVHIDADGVHAVFHHRIQRAGQLQLGHVMLVLADTDGFRVDLHQLGQRVLQAAGDGHGAAQGNVQFGEFPRGQFGGRIHRGAGLADHDLGHLQLRAELDQVDGQLVGLAAGGAVADGDQVDIVLGAELGQHGEGAVPVVLRRVRVDGGGIQQFAGGIDHGHLAAGAQARVEAEGGARAGRCGQQQVMQVAGEDVDRLGLGAVAQLAEQVGFQMGVELDLPGPAHHFAQPLVGGPALLLDAEALGNHQFARMAGARQLLAHLQRHAEDALVAAAEDGQRTVRGGVAQHFVVLEVVAELGAFGFLARNQAGAEGGFLLEETAQFFQQAGVFGEALHEDVLGAFEHGLGVGKAFFGIDETGSLAFRVQSGVAEQRIGQLAEAGFQGDLALGAALLLVGQVEVFQPGLGIGFENVALEFAGQLALLLDAGEDGRAALVQLAQVAQALFQGTQLGVVEAAGHFLAVAGDKGHGRALVEQGHGGGDLLWQHAAGGNGGELFGDTDVDAVHGST